MRVDLTQSFVDKASVQGGAERTLYWDTGMAGFALQVTASGQKSFVFQYRAGSGSRRMKLDGKFLRLEAKREANNGNKARVGKRPRNALEIAEREAVAIRNAIGAGRDPLMEVRKDVAGGTLKEVAEDYLSRDGKKLRSIGERCRLFEKYVYPKLGSAQINDISRSDVVRLLDKIEDNSGPVQADAVLAAVRKLFNWHAARAEEFRTPLVKGMSRARPSKERARERILHDTELRAFWRAAEAFPGCYGYLVRFILLTGTRLREASNMVRAELTDSLWTIPASRHKNKRKAFELPLSKAALELLTAVPKIKGEQGWVFTHDGKRAVGGFSKYKTSLDKAMLAELRKADSRATLKPWVVHDLRRTARTLMSQAGVQSRHAEMALGHAVQGVEGIYDRHRYLAEKAQAFEALATQIAYVLNDQTNVTPFRRTGSTS